jgi:hypothetical protein
MTKGYHPIHRSLLNHWLWKCKPFAKGQAWVDLILLANHKDEKVYRDGKIMIIKRGQIARSQTELGKRWGWDRRTSSRFLKTLKMDQMIGLQMTTRGTLITLLNYNDLHKRAFSLCPTDGTTDGTSPARLLPTNNKVNKRTINTLSNNNYINSKKYNSKNKDSKNNDNNINSKNGDLKPLPTNSWFESVWKLYPPKNKSGKRKALKVFVKTVKSEEDYSRILKAINNYNKLRRVKQGFVLRASRWFEEWEDYVDPDERETQYAIVG